jgi:hypothetical protein
VDCGQPLSARATTVAGFAKRGLAPLLLYAGVSLAYNSRVWTDPAHTYLGVFSDPLQTMWFLGWTPHAVAHGLNPWLTNYLNYPDGVNLLWNTSQPLTGLVLSPVSHFFGVMVAYNVMVTVALAVAPWTAYLCLRRYVRGVVGPLLGGLLYGFSPYVIAQSSGHANLLTIATAPLFILLFDDIVLRQRRRPWVDGLMLGALVSAQLLMSEEILTDEAISIGLVGIGCILFLRPSAAVLRRHARHAAVALGLGIVVALALCGWPLAVQFFGPQQLHGNPQRYDFYVTDLLGFVIPDSLQLVAPGRALAISQHFVGGNVSDIGGYLGLPLVLIVAWAAIRYRRDSVARVAGFAGLVMALFSLGPHLHIIGPQNISRLPGLTHGVPMPWWPFSKLPVLGALLPERFSFVVALFAAYFLARTVADLHSATWLVKGITVVLVSLSIIVLLPAQRSLATRQPDTPPFFTGNALSLLPDTAPPVLVVPVVAGAEVGNDTPSLWQAQSGYRYRMPGGYFMGPPDPGTGVHQLADRLADIDLGAPPTLAAPQRIAYRAILANAGIHTVVLAPVSAMNPEGLEIFLRTLLGPPSQTIGGVQEWTNIPRL